MNITALLSIVATIFLLIVTGAVGQKIGIIDEVMTKKMSSLIVNIGQPMLIISSLISIDCTPEMLKTGFLFFLLGIAVHAVMGAVAYFSSKFVRDLDERKITEFALVFSNCGFVGFPVAKALIGDIGLFYGAFFIMSFYVFLWSWGLGIMARKRKDIKITPFKVIFNPGTVPCYIGVAVLLVGLKLPSFVIEYTSYLASICTPVSVLVTGALLASKKPKDLFLNWRVYVISAVKLIALPLIAALIAKLVRLPDDMVIFAAIMAAMPSAAVTTMFGELYDIAPGYAAQLVGMSSLLSPASIPAVMLIVQNVILKI